jgi:hypothetical protein
MGDFNYPEIDYNCFTVEGGSESSPHKFFDKTQELFLTQYVDQCIRFRDGYNPSTLDYIYTDEPNLIATIDYEVPRGKSDHVCLTWNLTASKPVTNEPVNNRKRNFWKGNFKLINEELCNMDWDAAFSGKSLEDKWNCLKNALMNLVNKHVPQTTPARKPRSHNLSKATIRQIKLRNESWKDYQKQPTDDMFRRYKVIRNRTTTMVRSDHELERNKTFKSFKGKPKKFYAYMRDLQTVKDRVVTLKREDGTDTNNDKEAADELCRSFKEVFTMEDNADLNFGSSTSNGGDGTAPQIFEFTEEIVLNRLLHLDFSKSAGPDSLHPHLLKMCACNLARPLANIFQESFTTSQLPNDWKLANICPIFKKGSRSSAGNYRPVSLTSVPCKIMESIIKGVLTDFIDKKKIISNCQHGFLKCKCKCKTILTCQCH